jgi:hypothetical protein
MSDPVAKFDGAEVCVHDVSGLPYNNRRSGCYKLKKGEHANRYMPGFGTIGYKDEEFE